MSAVSTWGDVGCVSWSVSTGNVLLDASFAAFQGFLYPLIGYECTGILVWNVFGIPVCLLACCLDAEGPFALSQWYFGFLHPDLGSESSSVVNIGE